MKLSKITKFTFSCISSTRILKDKKLSKHCVFKVRQYTSKLKSSHLDYFLDEVMSLAIYKSMLKKIASILEEFALFNSSIMGYT